MKNKYFLVFLMMLLSIYKINAQNITINSGDMPVNLVACGDPGMFKFNVYGPLPSGTVISTTLPDGVKFNTLVSGNVTATPTATGVDFTLTSALTSASDLTTIAYTVNVPCSPTINSGTITYKTGALSKDVALPNVQYSLLEVTTVTPASATINVLGTQDYTYNVRQSANTYSNNIKIYITHSTNVSVTSPVVVLTLGTPSGTSQTDVLELTGAQIATIGNKNTRFEENEVYSNKISVKLLSCTTGETISFKAGYGCGSTTACQTGNTSSVGLTGTVLGDPKLTMTQTKQPWPGFLTSEADTANYTLTNIGTGPALKIKIQFGFATNGDTPLKKAYLNFFNFKVNGNSMSDDANDVAQFNFTTDPDGAGVGLEDLDGDGYFNDLPAGKSVNITAMLEQLMTTMNEACKPGYYNGAGTSGVDAVKWRLINFNSCGVDKSFNEANSALGTNTPFTMGVINQSSDIIAPNGNVNFDAVTNNTFSTTYTFGANATTISSGAGFNINARNAFWRVKVVLPPGVIPNTAITPTYSEAAKYALTYNSSVSDPQNNIYYYDLKPTASNQGAANLAITGRLTVPLKVAGSCNSNGVYNVKFSAALFRDATNVYIPELGCSTSPNFSLGCGTSQGLNIDSFDMKRQTFGYTNAAGTTLAVESNIPGGELNNYLNGDKGVMAYRLTLIDPKVTSATLTLEYDQHNWLAPGVANGGIKAITGSYTDPTTGVSTPFTIPAASANTYYTSNASYTGSDGKAKTSYVFDIMKLFQTGGPLAGITRAANAKISFNPQFVVNQDLYSLNANTPIDSNTGYVLTGINTYPTVTLGGNTIVGGNKADKATIFSYYVENTITGPSTIIAAQCTESSFSFQLEFSRNSSKIGNLFPTEFRYNQKIDRVEVLVPAGITLVKGQTTQSIPGGTSTKISDPLVTYGFDIDGKPNPIGLFDKYTFINDGTWLRQRATNNFDFSSFNFRFTVNNFYRTYQQTQPQFRIWPNVATGQFSLNFDTPRTITGSAGTIGVSTTNISLLNYVVTSAAPNHTTATNTASWPLTITNTSTSAISNFWIAIEVPNNNITPTLWDGATQITMESYGTGKYWAKVGSLPVGAKTFTIKSNSFTVCGTDSFKVKTSFECSGYPTDPTIGFESQGKRPLWTAPDVDMSITTQNPALTIESSVNSSGNQSFSICAPIDETLKVTNGANGYAYKIEPALSFPTGMQFVAGSFKVNYNGVDYAISDPTLVSGNSFKVNIYSNASVPFVTSGLPGTSNSVDPKFFILKYQVATVCYTGGVGNYISGSKIGYTIPYQSGCQAQMTALKLDSQPIELGGGIQGKTYANSLITLENPNNIGNHQINDGEEMRITVINQGDAVSSLETIKVFVDPAYDYQPNSYSLQAGNNYSGMPAVNEPTSVIDGTGKRQIIWTIPKGYSNASGANTIQFNFKLKVVNTSALSCAATNEVVMNTFIGTTLTCAINGNSCELEYPTGTNQKVTLKAFKPSITATVANSSFTNVGVSTNYTINYTITDSDATYDVKSQLKLMLYNDANNNGVVDSGEQLLDTQYTTASVAPSATSSGTMVGSYVGNAQNYVLIIDSNPTISDICSPVSIPVKSYCYKPGATTGTALDTKHGITALGRAGSTGDNWPMVRKGAWTALEAKTKGFVVNRLTTAQITALAQPVEGMMVYDTVDNCLKVYTTKDKGATFGWYCMVQQTCPN